MQADNYEQLFDIETAIEEGLRQLLEASPLTAFTRKNMFTSGELDAEGNPIEAFQKVRPRVEIRAQVTGPTPQAHIYLREPNEKHIDAFRFAVAIQVVDEPIAKPEDNTAHPLHRARVRWVLSAAEVKLTEAIMPYHEVARIWTAGSELSMRDAEGVEFSMLRYEGDVFIRPDAWPDVIV